MNSLTMSFWEHLLLLLSIPVVIGLAVAWWKLSTLSRHGSSRPLRKRKRRRH